MITEPLPRNRHLKDLLQNKTIHRGGLNKEEETTEIDEREEAEEDGIHSIYIQELNNLPLFLSACFSLPFSPFLS